MSSISPPYLHNPSLPTFCRWLTRTPTHDSSITHRDWLVPYVRASSWLVNLVVASALFVHVCCHVDVGVLCVVLVCEEHTCSLVSFVWNQLKKKCVPQIQSWNKTLALLVFARFCLLSFSIHPSILDTHFSRAAKFSISFSTPRFGGAKQDSAAYVTVGLKTQDISFAPVYSYHKTPRNHKNILKVKSRVISSAKER